MTILGKKQMSEEDIKLNYITPVILDGWKGHVTMETKITDGRINISGNIVARSKPKFADYMLYLNDGKPIAVVEIIYSLRNCLLHQSTPNVEQSRIHESRCKVDKFELVITGEDGANGDLSMVAYGKDMNIVRRELKVHISHLCYILCTAAEDYYKNNKEKFDFIKYSIEDDRPKTFL